MQLRRPQFAALAFTAILGTISAAAQNGVESNVPEAGFGPPPASTVPTIKVTSRETVVDVIVNDAAGNPVHGLNRSDFTVKEDGKPQPIRSFLETRKDTPATNSTPLPKLPPHVYTNRQPAPPSGTSNIILLDALNAEEIDQMRSRLAATKFLQTMPPGTQIALFGISNGLRILEGFSSDRESLAAAINDKKNSLFQPDSIKASPCGRQEFTLTSLRQIAAFVTGIKRKKNLIWFVGRAPIPQYPCNPRLDEEAFDMLAAAQVAIYPIDVRGLVNPLAGSVADPIANINVNTGARVAAGNMAALVGSGVGVLQLEALAERTGGVAFYNTNAIDQLIGKAIDNGANYYTLSYVPPGQNYDGMHHSIHVSLSRTDLHLVYRTGYGADDPKQLAAATPIPTRLSSSTPDPDKNTMTASMARFAPPATQILFDVKVAPTTTEPGPTDPPVMGFPAPDFKSKPMARYDLLYTFPADQINFSDGPNATHTGSLEFDVVASDVFGKLITSISRAMPFAFADSEYREFVQTPFRFFQQIDLPPGQTYLRIGILDRVSKKIGTVEIPLTVEKGLASSARQ